MTQKRIITRSKAKESRNTDTDVRDKSLPTKESQNFDMRDIIVLLKEQNNELIKCFNEGIQKIVTTLKETSSNKTEQSNLKEIGTKIDQLCSTIKNQNKHFYYKKPSNDNHDDLIKDTVKNRRFKYYQLQRTEKLCNYYESLVKDENNLFVPPKFRAKVNETTPNYEKEIKRDDSVNNVLRECKLMTAKCNHLLNEIKEIDDTTIANINSLDTTPTIKRNKIIYYTHLIKTEENRSKIIWEKNFNKLKATYDRLKVDTVEHVLKVKNRKKPIDIT